MKVAWVSRHPPLEAQVDELKKMFGSVELIHISDTFRDARNVLNAVKSAGAKISVVVLPLSMLAQYLPLAEREAIDVWFARMSALHECDGRCREFNPRTDVWLPLRGTNRGRHMRFERFEVVKEVRVITEPIDGRYLQRYADTEIEMEF